MFIFFYLLTLRAITLSTLLRLCVFVFMVRFQFLDIFFFVHIEMRKWCFHCYDSFVFHLSWCQKQVVILSISLLPWVVQSKEWVVQIIVRNFSATTLLVPWFNVYVYFGFNFILENTYVLGSCCMYFDSLFAVIRNDYFRLSAMV